MVRGEIYGWIKDHTGLQPLLLSAPCVHDTIFFINSVFFNVTIPKRDPKLEVKQCLALVSPQLHSDLVNKKLWLWTFQKQPPTHHFRGFLAMAQKYCQQPSASSSNFSQPQAPSAMLGCPQISNVSDAINKDDRIQLPEWPLAMYRRSMSMGDLWLPGIVWEPCLKWGCLKHHKEEIQIHIHP